MSLISSRRRMLLQGYAVNGMRESGLWDVETIRQRPNLGDIAIALKRTDLNSGPEMVYEVHIDDGIVKTATKSLSNPSKNMWKDVFELGVGSAVAIEFNGCWTQDVQKRYCLITEALPYIFWVDSSSNLQCQKWDNTTTKVQLATEVSKVAAIRGWKNVQVLTDDQGLICAFIKTDGTLWYTNYAEQTDGTTIWETAQQITLPNSLTACTDVNLFRTNDYRVGCAIVAGGNSYWMLTDRCWAGMSIEPENFSANCGQLTQIVLTELEQIDLQHYAEHININSAGIKAISLHDGTITAGTCTGAEIIDEHQLALTFTYALTGDVSRAKDYLTVSNESQSIYYPISSTVIGANQNELILNMNEGINAENNVLISYTDLGIIFVKPQQSTMINVPSFSVTAAGLVSDPEIEINITSRAVFDAVTLTPILNIGTAVQKTGNICVIGGNLLAIALTNIGTSDI